MMLTLIKIYIVKKWIVKGLRMVRPGTALWLIRVLKPSNLLGDGRNAKKRTLDVSLKGSQSSRFVFVANFLSNIFKESAERQIKFDPGYCLKLSELVPLVANFYPYFKVRFFFSLVVSVLWGLIDGIFFVFFVELVVFWAFFRPFGWIIKSVALVVKVRHPGLNSSYFINLIENILLCVVKIDTLLIHPNVCCNYVVTQAVHLSGPYRKIRTAQGANQNAPFQRGPVHNKDDYCVVE